MLATFQVLDSHMWLVATVFDSTDIEHFRPHKKLLDSSVLELLPLIFFSMTLTFPKMKRIVF